MSEASVSVQCTTYERYLDRAKVLVVAPDALRVLLNDGREVVAGLAMPVPYQPRVNDVLLVMGRRGQFYAIGVLRGRGSVQISSEEGFCLRALNGRLRVRAKRGIALRADTIRVVAHQQLLRRSSQAISTVCTAQREIRDRWLLYADQVAEVSDGSWLRKAKRVVIKVAKAIRFNGKQVRVG